MERCSETERGCFKESAACMDHSRFILQTSPLGSTCSRITSPGYSKHQADLKDVHSLLKLAVSSPEGPAAPVVLRAANLIAEA